jgi:hypothetical protein
LRSAYRQMQCPGVQHFEIYYESADAKYATCTSRE